MPRAVRESNNRQIETIPVGYHIPEYAIEYLNNLSFAAQMLSPDATPETRPFFQRVKSFYAIYANKSDFYRLFKDCDTLTNFKMRVHGILQNRALYGFNSVAPAVPREIIDQCETYIAEKLT